MLRRAAMVLVVTSALFVQSTTSYGEINIEEPRLSEGLPSTQTGKALPIQASWARKIEDLTNLRPDTPPRVLIVSSGVEPGIFPSDLAARIETVGTKGDPLGYGSYAASVVFQLSEEATITSLQIYQNGVVRSDFIKGAFEWAAQNVSKFDVVLLAFPPSDFLDPITSAMSAGVWGQMVNMILAAPHSTSTASLYGIAMDNDLFAQQVGSYEVYRWLSPFRTALWRWNRLIELIRYLNGQGISVVAPAGDLGPNPQTVFGLANLGEVVTVGGFNPPSTLTNTPGAISSASSSGPSIDLKIKPDLLAATGVVGVIPSASTLASYLSGKGMLDGNLTPAWSATGGGTVSSAKTLLDTTLTSASLAAVAMGAIGAGAEGLKDPARQRGALYTASDPLGGVAAYRQGQGVLGGTDLQTPLPNATFASSNPLVLTHADLGLEPEAAPWGTTLTVVQGTAGTPTASLTDFVGVDLLGQTRTEKITSEGAPTLTVGSLGQTVSVSASTGNDGKESGLYSGYISVPLAPSLPGGSPRTDAVPVVLTDGFKPVFRSLAIHDISANDFTLSLIPALPPAAKMLDHPLHMLPVDPLNQTLAFKVTGARSCVKYGKGDPNNPDPGTCNGHGVFGVIPPGYYLVRQFSDYGVPVEWAVNAKDASGLPITLPKEAEIGNPLGYTSFETLLLPRGFDGPITGRRLCQENYGPWDDWSGHSGSEQEVQSWKDAGKKMWKPCTQEFLGSWFGDRGLTPPEYDRFTGGFVVKQTAPLPDLRLNLGFVRKRSEAAVSSRYIDILHPCQELRFLSFRTPPVTSLESLATLATEPTGDWSTGCDGLETFLATFNNPGSDSTVEIGVGLAEYPFNLTTPNYTTHLSLNFPYEVNNAFILVAVSIGTEVGWGVVSPPGVIRLPPAGLGTEINLGGVAASGFGKGTANFEFRFLSRGVSTGKIQFLFVPAQYQSTGGTSSPVPSSAVLKDNPLANETVSFEVDTWALVPWPAMNFRNRLDNPATPKIEPLEPCSAFSLLANECGHTFRLSSNFSPWRGDSEGNYLGGQIRGESRAIDNGSENAEVKEDWVVLVHSPELPALNAALIGSSLMDVVDASNPDHLTSILGGLKAAGAALYTPDAATHHADFLIAFNGGIEAGEILSTKLGGKLTTTRDFFELLAMPMSFLSQFPGSIEVCINDGLPRATSLCPGEKDAATGAWTVQEVPVDLSFPKTEGPVKVSPYIPYLTQSTFIE